MCVDIGSTYTKGAAVDASTGVLLAVADHPTTLEPDVLVGLDEVRRELDVAAGGLTEVETLVCSSAGGGLRLAVVGYERVVTAEAGYRVGLSAGARVVHVAAGRLDPAGLAALAAARPDVVLLVGGTDGGDVDVILHNGGVLARSRLRCPVVVAGNAEATTDVVTALVTRGKHTLSAANVLPRIGVLDPGPARAAIREVFIRHVIGGKRLSRGNRFATLVRAATPDAVLAGVEVLADGAEGSPGVGDVLVVDVGGATTDVYSVGSPDPEERTLRREVVEVVWRGRTVEGDLGVRWTAVGVVDAAAAERLLGPDDEVELRAGADRRAADPSYLPPADDPTDLALAGLAARIAVRRHARPQVITDPTGAEVRRGGRDLRRVRVVVGSGGALRHASPDASRALLEVLVDDHGGGWRVPEQPRLVVDASYVLAPAGLLALAGRPELASRLLRSNLG